MTRRLIVVEDSFEVKGRGLVLVPGFLPEGNERFRAGDSIRLRKPDGSTVVTRIGSLELLAPNTRGDVAVLLMGLTKGDVLISTEVWSIDEASRPR